MSWTIKESGKAVYASSSGDWTICCDTADPQAGIGVSREGAVSGEADRDPAESAIRLLPSEGQAFPALEETYVRGNDLVCRYPQRDDDLFGLEVCYRVIPLETSGLAIETICSIQTTLLDCHPTCDVASGLQVLVDDSLLNDSALLAGLAQGSQVTGHEVVGQAVSLAYGNSPSTPPAITRLKWQVSDNEIDGEIHLILPPSDRAAAAVIDPVANDETIRYRLLAEFLEKGVIRKARVWTVLWKTIPNVQQVQHGYQQLMKEPLPLTP